MSPSLRNIVAEQLQADPDTLLFQQVGGGSINETGKLTTSGKNFFFKINIASKFPQLFQKEEKALRYLSLQSVIRIPEVLGYIKTITEQVLILEWISTGTKTAQFWKDFGSQLAALHSISNNQFGWEEDNYMGSVVQPNNWTDEWISFFINQRLSPLVQQCHRIGLLANRHLSQFENLYKKLEGIFSEEAPALLHGDLWSGNYMCSERGEPVLIDPAIYFGHRSIDLGMTTLFGGFDQSFYEAYHYHFPLPSNYQEQWQVCNLYPLLIHLLLFGSSYRPQIEQILRRF